MQTGRRALFSFAMVTALFVTAIYPTIWLHELGHSASAFFLGCKEDWWSTHMTPYLYKSFGGDIDYSCLASQGMRSVAVVEGAGVGMNLLMMMASLFLALRVFYSGLPHIWLLTFAACHHINAATYLTFNVFFPRSDMISVIASVPLHPLAFGILNSIVMAAFVPAIFFQLEKSLVRIGSGLAARIVIVIAVVAIASLMLLGRSDLTEGPEPGVDVSELRNMQ